jgi:predicted AAA+ superfamily ATPase
MKYRKRRVEGLILELCSHFPVVAVLGARQTGKSTLVRHLLGKDYKEVVFDPIEDVGQARADADLFLANNPGRLFLDEVQYAPELLSAIKRRVDRDPQVGAYILSGSQNLAVVKGIAESLAGRVAIVELPGMSRVEIDEEHSCDFLRDWVGGGVDKVLSESYGSRTLPWYSYIFRGGFPGVLDLPDRLLGRYFSSYLQTYIERDIRTVADIGNLQLFSRFYRLLAALSSTEINASQLGRDLDIDRRTAQNWIRVLEATYQWIEIPAFSRNPVKRIAGKSKGIFADSGMLCFLQRITSPEMIANHPLQGRLIETWVIMEIVRVCMAWDTPPAFYHYRSAGGAEVDLILEFNGVLYPIEIKSKSHPSRKDVSGIKSFREAFPNENIADGLLVCAIDGPSRISDNALAIPWHMLS